jgi:predicted Zn-dependent protease
VVIVRVITGAGPGQSGAATAESMQAQVDEAIRTAKQRLLEQRPLEAETVLRATLDRYPNQAEVRLLLGEALVELGRPADAYEQYNEALGLKPDNAELQFATGTLASVAGMIELAERHYNVAQTLDPGNPKYPLYLAQIQRKLGKLDAAREHLVRTVKLQPDLAIAWGSLADIALVEHNLSMASHYIEMALEIDPSNPSWRLVQARILRREGRPKEAAIILAAVAEEQAVPDPMVLREQALCMGLLGRRKDAAALYGRAVEIGHPDPATLAELNYEAALWHERLGDGDAAAQYAKRAMELGEDRAKVVVDRLAQGS